MGRSLRLRLFTIILAPLLVIAVIAGVWRMNEARQTAQDLYDNSLLITGLAVSRDVALADGDLISPETEALLADTAGGLVRYHVYAPDGVFVTGYAVPPVPTEADTVQDKAYAFYDAVYKGRDVRVLRLKYVTQIDGFSGTFTVTLWQDQAVRQGFVTALGYRALALISVLVLTAALMVWFGVNVGLKPLLDLEDAISRRNPEDLSPIRRRVPIETRGIVERLNRLFGQVSQSMEAQSAFISDASHQLRNPIAGVRALGEAILTARSLDAAKARAGDLVTAAERASDLAENLMTLERARAAQVDATRPVDVAQLLRSTIADFEGRAARMQVRLTLRGAQDQMVVRLDSTMVQEAIKNLIDNALLHGGPGLSAVDVTLAADHEVRITVADDGQGVPPGDFPKILARFGQADPSDGSGLGLSIAEVVANRHGGALTLDAVTAGFSASMRLPRDAQRPIA
ncbi:sensor histidine kinase [uncultured Tateyamaria sp.]|uniref:sensor histidine kinase n=1 Tax=uncultured Tateyamaria sp. TaxID=455651 RepID=UPI002618390B|nr:sensor histidine kinase [uncultured Tateyamaria sp.]